MGCLEKTYNCAREAGAVVGLFGARGRLSLSVLRRHTAKFEPLRLAARSRFYPHLLLALASPVRLFTARCSPALLGRGGGLEQVPLAFGKSILALTRVNCKQFLPSGNPRKQMSVAADARAIKKAPAGGRG